MSSIRQSHSFPQPNKTVRIDLTRSCTTMLGKELDLTIKRFATLFAFLASFTLLAAPAASAAAVCYDVNVQVGDTAVTQADYISN